MTSDSIEAQVAELSLWANYLDSRDKRRTIIWFELIRKALEHRDIERRDRAKLFKLLFKNCTSERCRSNDAMRFYVPYAMRCFFALGDFTEKSLVSAKALYTLLSKQGVLETIDVHFFYHQLYGFPQPLMRVMKVASEEAESADTKTKQLLLVLHKVSTLETTALSQLPQLTHLPHETTDSDWKKLPWLAWQIETMKDII